MYTQNFEGCTHQAELEEYLNSSALETFRRELKLGNLPPLSLVQKTEDIQDIQKAATSFENLDDVLILGTGGSSLGGKTLCSLSKQAKPRLHFLDNIDPSTFEKLFDELDFKTTGILAISKSGSTVETLMQLLTCLQRFEAQGLSPTVVVITENTSNPLRKIALTHNWLCLDHPTDVGGRFSCFSLVGLLPMILAGLDPIAFRKGAQAVLKQHLEEDAPQALIGAATIYAQKKTQLVLMPYADHLFNFCLWHRQLWAESLGKDGQGTTPIQSLGTVDQHSQLQLYLGGPKDKFFTLFTLEWKGTGDRISSSLLPEFQGKTMGDLFAAEQKATLETLLNHGCPVRLMTLKTLDEESLGGLMMQFMIETILTSYFMGVNAFDQPAVEEGKRLAREFLAA